MTVKTIQDNGGRRSGTERRQNIIAGHYPEKRSGMDRRRGNDRRSGKDRRKAPERRNGMQNGSKVLDLRKDQNRRVRPERRAAFAR